MINKRKAPRRARAGLQALRTRLRAAEDALRALRAGEVDAVVATRDGTERVITLQGADLPYRILLDQMYAGAVTLTPDGVIVYSNGRFADIVRMPLARVIGSPLRRFVAPAERPELDRQLARARRDRVRADLSGRAGDGTPVPLAVTFAPLQLDGGDDVQGVVCVVFDATERKREDELRTRLIEQVMTAQEEERGRIARELHDETGQSLTALLVGLRTIEGSRTMGEVLALAQRLREVAAQTLHEVGRLSRGLHPRILDDVGLAAAVVRHVQDFANLHGIAVDVQVDGLDAHPLPPLFQATLFRVLQEALTNAGKHAAARNVTVRLVRDDAMVELRVHDDGRGFDPRDSGRLGLRGMRERAALLGGSVAVEAHPGGGTTITTRVPVRGA